MALTEGTQLEPVEVTATLRTSVAYAGASGDLNPLHYDEEFAAGVALVRLKGELEDGTVILRGRGSVRV